MEPFPIYRAAITRLYRLAFTRAALCACDGKRTVATTAPTADGPSGDDSSTYTPSASDLHDGRARALSEAIRWQGGEGKPSRDAWLAASESDPAAVIRFLDTL